MRNYKLIIEVKAENQLQALHQFQHVNAKPYRATKMSPLSTIGLWKAGQSAIVICDQSQVPQIAKQNGVVASSRQVKIIDGNQIINAVKVTKHDTEK